MYNRSYFYSCENLFYELLNPVFDDIRENVSDLFKERVNYVKTQNLASSQDFIYLIRQTLREYQESQIKLKLLEIESEWDLQNWKGVLSRRETESLLGKKDTLLILFSPPEISLDAPSSFQFNLPIEFKGVKDKVKQFYPENDEKYQVKFYTDYFKNPVGDVDIEKLYNILSPVPTGIFYTNITDYSCRFNIGFWHEKSLEPKIISSPLWDWENTLNKFQNLGMDEKKSLRYIRDLILTYNQLLASYLIDVFYLSIDPFYQFRFPLFISHIAKELIKDKERIECYFLQLKQIQEEEIIILEERAKKKDISIKEDANKWKLFNKIEVRGDYPIYSIAIHPNEEIVAGACGYEGVQEYDIASGNPLRVTMGSDHSILAVTYDWSGDNIICGGGKQAIYVHGKARFSLSGHSNAIKVLAISPDRTSIASVSYDSTIKLWDFNKRELIKTLIKHSKGVYAVAFSPDGKMLASGGGDNTAKLWNLSNYQVIHNLTQHLSSVLCVGFSPDGKVLATGSMDKMIRLWNTDTGELINTLMGHSFWVESLAFSPQGFILVSSSNDKTLKFWNWVSGECVRTITSTTGWISAIAFNHDGSMLVTGGNNGVIKIWHNS